MKRFALTAALLFFLATTSHADDKPAKPAVLPGMEFLAKVMLDYLDTNGDGILDNGEFTNGTGKGFTDLDRDSDGFVTKEEMDAAGAELSESQGSDSFLGKAAGFLLNRLLLTMDDNKDGQVSKAEFTKGCEAMFTKLDANQDSQINKDELMALPARLFGK
jgi:Ca2+-binding EF-hand superfamily protein